jgi:tetratricopeptide (TPR) repeat protein
MRYALLVLTLFLAAAPAWSQRHKVGEINAEKPDGALLQQIGQEKDDARKVALMEQFLTQFPKHAAAGWVLEQLQPLCVKAGQPDKIIAAGEKLVALDADDTEAALQTLKAYEAKKDAAAVLKWSAITSAAARKMVAAPKPSDADAVKAWTETVDYAKQVDTYTEYALYRAAIESPDPKVTIQLGEALQARNAKSEYMLKVSGPLFNAYRQTGASDKALALAEQVLAVDQTNEEMLVVVADSYMQGKKEPEKLHEYCAKAVELLNAKPKPDGVAEADWKKRKDLLQGIAYYMNGKQYFNENKFAPADKELRGALPLVGANAAMKPEVLFLLGMANYKMEKAQDALNFFRECSAIKSPFQAPSLNNIKAVRGQYRGLK